MRGIRGERVCISYRVIDSWAQEGEEGILLSIATSLSSMKYRTTTIEPKLVWTLRCPRDDLQYYRVQIIDLCAGDLTPDTCNLGVVLPVRCWGEGGAPEHVVLEITPKHIISPLQVVNRCLIPHKVTLRRQTGSVRALVQGKPIEFAIQHNGQASIAGIYRGKSKPRAINPLVGSCVSTMKGGGTHTTKFRGKPPSPRVMLAMYEHNTLSPALRSSTERSTIAHERLRTWLRPPQHLCCCNLGFRI
ncbi:unnamed protein product [Tuber melanosporum]|uniref:(Perigord truffle) hypothetical protein n=1 Tax=Tuber melanosporum (strain Mel28) TaxID=656061 RepID=D5GH04_TUBMM|nr:uncharacterized protein GSTUM_00007641001 [Tuber melanosporum]CAZ83797.1 unnamed protein product [Tuber melanosporum]